MSGNKVQLVLGVDSSTQSTKVEIRDLQTGTVVAQSSAKHPPTTPPVSEQDPDAWWQALSRCFTDVKDHLANVVGVSIAGQQHGLVMLDENGAPLRPAKLWNDTTSAPQSASLIEKLGASRWVEGCGSLPGAAFTVCKLAWVAEHEPELMDRVAYIGLPHDYLTWRLTGQWTSDRGDASGSGWWSPSTNEYQPHLLAAVNSNLLDCVPKVLGPKEVAGHVKLDGFSFAADTIVGSGSGDNMGAAMGLGLKPGDVVISLGTSGTAYAVSTTPTADENGSVAGFADATGNYLPLVCTLNATKVTDAVARLLGADFDAFAALVMAAPSGAGGVVTVPYFDGERTPNKPDATGAITGLRSDVSREQLARSSVEGVCCGLLDGVDALERAGVTMDGQLYLIGGGAQSQATRSVMATLAQRSLVVPDAAETVATGACVQAAVVFEQSDHAQVAQRWSLGQGTMVTVPDAKAGDDAVADIRERYRTESLQR